MRCLPCVQQEPGAKRQQRQHSVSVIVALPDVGECFVVHPLACPFAVLLHNGTFSGLCQHPCATPFPLMRLCSLLLVKASFLACLPVSCLSRILRAQVSAPIPLLVAQPHPWHIPVA